MERMDRFLISIATFLVVIAFSPLVKPTLNLPAPYHFQCACAADAPQFAKEGELTFLEKQSRTEIVKIDIEIADNEYERTMGLMYRKSLPEKGGMLFVFERSAPLSFWMRNTYIPLDIIFADQKKQIITMYKKTEPLSYDAIRSKKNAQYVIELNAGFCNEHGINVGDWIRFQRITPQHPTPSP